MSYDVHVQGNKAVSRAEVHAYMVLLPDIHPAEHGYVYTDEDEDFTVEIDVVGDSTAVTRFEFKVPSKLDPSAAARMAGLCTGVAQRFGWDMREPHSGGVYTEANVSHRFAGKYVLSNVIESVAPANSVSCIPALIVILVLVIILALGVWFWMSMPQ